MKNEELCNFVKSIVNLTPNQIDGFITICIDSVIHNIATTLSENTDGRIRYVDLEIPYIGILTANVSDDGKMSNIVVTINGDVKEKLELAITEFKSPLIDRAESVVAKQIADRYRSLL